MNTDLQRNNNQLLWYYILETTLWALKVLTRDHLVCLAVRLRFSLYTRLYVPYISTSFNFSLTRVLLWCLLGFWPLRQNSVAGLMTVNSIYICRKKSCKLCECNATAIVLAQVPDLLMKSAFLSWQWCRVQKFYWGLTFPFDQNNGWNI